jgi:ABC-type uncharacterized transport system permease subunit
MNNSLLVQLLVSGVVFGTPLLLAALGELITERAGVLNLGVEGMMLMGAVSAFWVAQRLHGPNGVVLVVACLAAIIAGALMAAIHAFLVITLRANQIVSGLALTIFAGSVGLSSYLAQTWKLSGTSGKHKFAPLNVFGLKDLPVVGPLLFHHYLLVYVSWAFVAALAFYLNRTRQGLNLRAVGEEPRSADAMGINVVAYRYVHTIVGGALAGLAGSFFTLAIATSWSNGLTAGAGWIAIALVIFAFWRPLLVLAGAYLFGIVSGLGLNLQARGSKLPPELFNVMPYLMTIIALVLVSSVWAKKQLGAPRALGVAYAREEQ